MYDPLWLVENVLMMVRSSLLVWKAISNVKGQERMQTSLLCNSLLIYMKWSPRRARSGLSMQICGKRR